MASIRRADYFSTKVPNRAGTGARLLDAMKAARVDLYAFTGFPEGGGAQVDFVPKNRSAFLRAAKKAGLRLSPRKTVFLVQGSDKVGALTAALGKLAGAGIGLVALNAVTAGSGRYGAMFWVKPRDVGRAARVLRAR